MGEVSYKGVWRQGLHPAAIDRETWDRCQEHLRRRAVHRETTKCTDRVYPLRKLLVCAVCGHALRGQPSHGVRCYKDIEAARRRCPEPQIVKADEIEAQLGAFLKRAVVPDNWKELILKQLDAAAELDQHEAKRKALVNRMTRVRNLYIAGDLPELEYQKEKREVETALSKLHTVALPDLEQAAQLLKSVGVLWEHATDGERLELARSIFEKLILRQGKLVACEPRAPLFPLFALAEGQKNSDLILSVGIDGDWNSPSGATGVGYALVKISLKLLHLLR